MTTHDQVVQKSADEIETTLRQLADSNGLKVSSCNWSLGKGVGHATHHRLDVCANYQTFKIYFTDPELLDYSNPTRQFGTETRLHDLIGEFQENPWAIPYFEPLKRLASHVRP